MFHVHLHTSSGQKQKLSQTKNVFTSANKGIHLQGQQSEHDEGNPDDGTAVAEHRFRFFNYAIKQIVRNRWGKHTS